MIDTSTCKASVIIERTNYLFAELDYIDHLLDLTMMKKDYSDEYCDNILDIYINHLRIILKKVGVTVGFSMKIDMLFITLNSITNGCGYGVISEINEILDSSDELDSEEKLFRYIDLVADIEVDELILLEELLEVDTIVFTTIKDNLDRLYSNDIDDDLTTFKENFLKHKSTLTKPLEHLYTTVISLAKFIEYETLIDITVNGHNLDESDLLTLSTIVSDIYNIDLDMVIAYIGNRYEN